MRAACVGSWQRSRTLSSSSVRLSVSMPSGALRLAVAHGGDLRVGEHQTAGIRGQIEGLRRRRSCLIAATGAGGRST